jgi:hypothetical protein
MLTRQELVLQFMLALAANDEFKFNKPSVDLMHLVAEALADKYLESL